MGAPRASDTLLAHLQEIRGVSSPTISVVIATLGRPTLQRAVDSARWADEIVVVYDAEELPARIPDGARAYACGPTNHWGAEQREYGIARASGTHVAFMDDDDVYIPGASPAIRRAVRARPARVHIFKMRDTEREYGGHGSVVQGSIGSPMFVVPKNGPLGRWSTRYEGDFDFITSTLAQRGDKPRFHGEVVALVRPGDLPRRP
jgi:glycosyltransferase involved in cell wall biosynthesis